MRVLIVEDNPEVAAVISEYLKPISSSISIARDMKTAMSELSTVPPYEIVTLDLHLPDSGVGETLKRVHDIKEKTPNCLLLVITSMLSKEEKGLAIKAGADGEMHKEEALSAGMDAFLKTLCEVGRSILRVPVRYTQNIEILEQLTNKISSHFGTK